jgi:hypothetical protein
VFQKLTDETQARVTPRCGASQALDYPGTLELSNAVLSALRKSDGYPDLATTSEVARDIRATQPPRVEPLIDSIRRAGSENFETDMHALESLMTLAPFDVLERGIGTAGGQGRRRPAIANLVDAKGIYPALAHREALLNLMFELVATVRQRLEIADKKIDPIKFIAARDFFAELAQAYQLLIYSLNYDEGAPCS